MSEEYRNLIYESYITNLIGEGHLNSYDSKLQIKYFKKNYLKYMPKNKDAKILELGTGMGQFYSFCLKYGYTDYEGIDLSTEEIKYVKETINKDVIIHQMDILDYLKNAASESFDVIVYNDVIEHLYKNEICELLLMVRRVLKKGGVFLIKTPNMANPFVSTAGRYIAFDHEIGFTETSMREILKATGYTDIKIVGTNIYVAFPVLNQIAWLCSKIMNVFLWLLSSLYGRTYLKIFEKDILAIVRK